MLEYVGQANCTKKRKKKKFYNFFQQEKATLGIGLLNGISSPDPSAPAGTPSSLQPRITGGSEKGKGEKGRAGGLTSSYDPPLETYKKGWCELIFHEF